MNDYYYSAEHAAYLESLQNQSQKPKWWEVAVPAASSLLAAIFGTQVAQQYGQQYPYGAQPYQQPPVNNTPWIVGGIVFAVILLALIFLGRKK